MSTFRDSRGHTLLDGPVVLPDVVIERSRDFLHSIGAGDISRMLGLEVEG